MCVYDLASTAIVAAAFSPTMSLTFSINARLSELDETEINSGNVNFVEVLKESIESLLSFFFCLPQNMHDVPFSSMVGEEGPSMALPDCENACIGMGLSFSHFFLRFLGSLISNLFTFKFHQNLIFLHSSPLFGGTRLK